MPRALLGGVAAAAALGIGGVGTTLGAVLAVGLAGLMDASAGAGTGWIDLCLTASFLLVGAGFAHLAGGVHRRLLRRWRLEERTQGPPFPRGWSRLRRECLGFAGGYALGLLGGFALSEAALLLIRWPVSASDWIPGFGDREPGWHPAVWIVLVLSSPTIGLLVARRARRILRLPPGEALPPVHAPSLGAESAAV